MRYHAALVSILALASCAKEAPERAPRGAELLRPFKAKLMKALQEGMAEGATRAIDICKLEAPRIAASLSVDGVRVGRTSHKLRNPANAGPAWTAAVLADYRRDPKARAPRTVALGDRVGYAEPILVQALCLACHGQAFAPELAAQIDRQYPEDRARGFALGDLRGIFWVEYPQAN